MNGLMFWDYAVKSSEDYMERTTPQFCVICSAIIPRGRMLAMPGTRTCAEHSDAVPRTENDLDIAGSDQEDLRQVAKQPKGEL